jgi:hypothetical protein
MIKIWTRLNRIKLVRIKFEKIFFEKSLGSATTLYGTVALSFVIPKSR